MTTPKFVRIHVTHNVMAETFIMAIQPRYGEGHVRVCKSLQECFDHLKPTIYKQSSVMVVFVGSKYPDIAANKPVMPRGKKQLPRRLLK